MILSFVNRSAILAGFLCFAAVSPIHAQNVTQNVLTPDNKGLSKDIPQPHASKRDVLWGIVQCLNGQSPAVRATPESPGHACGTIVLDEADEPGQDSVILEDTKMSKCSLNAGASENKPRSFAYVHALAIPLARMTGVEQEENRPQGIWDLAWRKAKLYIPETNDIALVANPKAQNQYRSQDQLHIHLVRLKPGARAEILNAKGSRRVPPTYIDRLSGTPDPVWAAAELNAGMLAARLGVAPGLKSGAFGIAVIYDESKGQYAVVAVNDSPERDFTVQCPDTGWKP